jgi:type II secretory pathway predicted ATPase ExeA
MEKTDIVIETDNFATIMKVCNETLVNKEMNAIIGEPGYGKTTAFEAFSFNYDSNVFYVRAQKSLNSKEFFSLIYNTIGSESYNPSYTISYLIRKTANKFTENSSNKLLIIDEAGKFNMGMLEYLHEFRDLTQQTTGIILGGPDYFKSRVKDWKDANKPGIPEVYSRINSWIDLEPPTSKEKMALANEYGVFDKVFIKYLDKNCHDFRKIVVAIKKYLKSQPKL